jgi:hypothetical protein
MFGRGRFNPGVVIDPKPEFAFDPKDQEKLAEFRTEIWYVASEHMVDLFFHGDPPLTMVRTGRPLKK